MTTTLSPGARWVVAAAAQPDAATATVFRLDDEAGTSRVLDTVAGVLLAPVRTEHIVGRQPWYPATGSPPLEVLLLGIDVADDAPAGAMRPSGSSLGRPTARVRQWQPEEETVLTREQQLFPAEVRSEWGGLFTHLRAVKPRGIGLTAYVGHLRSDAMALSRWLRTPAPTPPHLPHQTAPINLQEVDLFADRWLLGPGDSLHLIPVEATAATAERWNQVCAVWRDEHAAPFDIHVSGRSSRPERYYESMGFSDVVAYVADVPARLYCRDLWTWRSNALVVPARGRHSTELIRLIGEASGAAAFLADPTSTRLWQHLTPQPDIDRLFTCLQRLFVELTTRSDAGTVRDELAVFLDVVRAGGLPESACRQLNDRILADKTLAQLDLPVL